MRLRRKITVAFFLVSALVSLLLALFLYRFVERQLRAELRNRLRNIATLGARTLDPGAFGRLRAQLGALTPDAVLAIERAPGGDYQRLSEQLNAIRAAEPGLIRYVYVLAPTADPDQPRFVVDADVLAGPPDDATLSHFAQAYDARDVPLLKRALVECTPQLESTFVYDPEFKVRSVSAYVPLPGGRDGAGKVIVEIADTGAGMTAEVRARIFDPYFTTKAQGQGTGLGLSISLGIVTSMGGTIDVTSAPGHGTTVRVELPAIAPTVAVAPAPVPAAPTPAPARTVLVIDDEELVARTVARMLSAHRTEIAYSGRDALARAPLARFDAIVCDLMMPDLTGMELFAQVTARDPALASRFVFLTGGVFTDDARAFLDAPGRRWLSKPVSRRELQQAVDAIAGPTPS